MTYIGVGSVFDVQHGQEHFEDFFPELLVGDTWYLLSRGFGLKGKSKGLCNSKGGKMVIVLLVVCDLTDCQFGIERLDSPSI